MLYAILIAILLVADQWVKYWTTINVILDTGEYALFPGIVKIVNVHNPGAAFGFMESAPYMRWIFAGLAIVITVVIVIVMIRRVFPGKFPMLLCALAIAGSLGNCIDRFVSGYVVDMFKLEFVNFAVFNVADAYLTVACILFIFYLLFFYKGDRDEEDEDDEEAPVYDDGGIELAGFKSTDIEESAPAKPLNIDSAFWGKEKEAVRREPAEKRSVEKEPVRKQPVEKEPVRKEVKKEPVKKPVEKEYNFDLPSFGSEPKDIFGTSDFGADEFSLESILEEFR